MVASTSSSSSLPLYCRADAMTVRFRTNRRKFPCSTRLWADAITHYSSGAVASHPRHGTLTQSDMLNCRYKSTTGFKGVDRYGLKVCGTDGAGSGCATITYNIAVE